MKSLIISFLLLSGGAAIAEPLPMTAELKVAGTAAITERLKDPGSAQFGPEAAAFAMPDGTVSFCSSVNAKNNMGGYVGMQPAWASLRKEGDKFVGVDADLSRPGYRGYFWQFHPECPH